MKVIRGTASSLLPGGLNTDDLFVVTNNLSEGTLATKLNNLGVMDQRQVETATAAGTITGAAGVTAAVVVTAAGMTGSPITLNPVVVSGDTATVWAGKVRTALNANANIIALFTVGGTGTAISLTRTIAGAHDTTMNISLDNGTCGGITAALTSANTKQGIEQRPVRHIVWRAVAVATDTVAASSTILESAPCPITGTIVAVYADNDTEGTTGTATYDIHLGGITIMSATKISIETGETSSRTATTQPVLTTTAVTAGGIFTLFCDAVQSATAAKGLVFTIDVRETV